MFTPLVSSCLLPKSREEQKITIKTMVARTRLSATSTLLRARAAADRSGLRRYLSALPSWATLDPSSLGLDPEPYAVSNLVDGNWSSSKETMAIPNPMDKDAPPVCTIPDTQESELSPFLKSLKVVPKSGVHNPLKNVERYLQFGEISRKVSEERGF